MLQALLVSGPDEVDFYLEANYKGKIKFQKSNILKHGACFIIFRFFNFINIGIKGKGKILIFCSRDVFISPLLLLIFLFP